MRERFWRAYRLELRQFLRHWSYWLVQALFALFMWSTFGYGGFFTAQELLWVGVGRNATGLTSLIALFLAAFGTGRARRVRIGEVEAALPTGAEVTLARWAAIVTAMLPFVVWPLAMALTAGPFGSFWEAAPTFVFEFVLTVLFSAALIWLIEATRGIRRWMYPLLAVVWIATAIATVTISIGGRPVPGIGLVNFSRFGYGSYAEGWGRLLQGDLPAYFNLFYVGLIPLVIGLIVRRIDHKRFYRTTRAARGLISGAAAVALVAFGLYAVTVAQANARVRMQPDHFVSLPKELRTDVPADLPYTVTRYDVTLNAETTPRFTVSMDVFNRGGKPLDSLRFTLNDSVKITEAGMDYMRDGDYFALTLPQPLVPGDTLTIELAYEGEFYFYGSIPGAPPEATNFVRRDAIHLGAGAAWYPIPGRLWFNVGLEQRLPDVLAAFTLRVEGADVPVASNLPRTGENTFASSGTTWATLLGAPRLETHEVADGVTVITTEYQYDKVGSFIEEAFSSSGREVVSRYFPDSAVTLIMLGSRYSWYSPSLSSPAPMTEGVALTAQTPWYAGSSDYWGYEYGIYPVVQKYFGNEPTTMDSRGPHFTFGMRTLLIENVAQFVSLQAQSNGDIERMRELLVEKIATMHAYDPNAEWVFGSPGYASSYVVTDALIDVYAEYGEDGVARLLDAMQAEVEALAAFERPADTAAWIEAWVAEHLADA